MGAASPAVPGGLTANPPGRVFEFRVHAHAIQIRPVDGEFPRMGPPIDDDMEVMVENALSEV